MMVLPIGQKVKLDDGIDGIITAICIMSGEHIRYEVAWWSGRTRNCMWLEEEEVSTNLEHVKGRIQVGFHTGAV